MFGMSSMITWVFPTRPPPKIAALPPLRKGQMRSMTLMPVSRISADVDWSTNDGGSRWIGSRRTPFTGPFPSIGSPTTLKSRPRVSGPTGTVIGPPVRSEEHTSELQSLAYLVCRLLLEKKKKKIEKECYELCVMTKAK